MVPALIGRFRRTAFSYPANIAITVSIVWLPLRIRGAARALADTLVEHGRRCVRQDGKLVHVDQVIDDDFDPFSFVDYRWAAGDAGSIRRDAAELIALTPDVILSQSTPALAALKKATSTIPIVFVSVSDPVGDGFVASLAKPAGNITGFSNFEPTLAGKWLELVKQAAPRVERIVVLFNPTFPHYFLPAMEAAASSLAVQLVPGPVQSDAEIEATISAVGPGTGSGLVVLPDQSTFFVSPKNIYRLHVTYAIFTCVKAGRFDA